MQHTGIVNEQLHKPPHPFSAELAAAQSEFRAHWRSFPNIFPCEFAGTLEDINALDYLDYEGLRYPPSYWKGAALIWGNVLVQQLGFSWATGPDGEFLLTHDAPDNRITILPYARILEAQERSRPKFGRYAWLLDRAIQECLQFGDLSDVAKKWSEKVLTSWERTGTPWS